MEKAVNEPAVRERIRHYVDTAFMQRFPQLKLRDDDRLMKRGIVDSMGAIQLIRFLETEFGIQVWGDDVSEQTLGSVTDLTRFVLGKVTAPGERTS